MARSELNSLLDVAARHAPEDDDRDSGSGLYGFSENELREEIERRRKAHDEVEEAIHGRRGPADTRARPDAARENRRPPPPQVPPSEALRIQKAYAALEVPAGSDFEAVRRAYRSMMRKYHPDRHTATPEKQKAANEVAQRLTESYKLLEKTLRK